MNTAIQEVETGEITTASRNVEINGVDVKQGEVIALLNGNLICSTNSVEAACLKLLEKADTVQRERITFFYGDSISEKDVAVIIEKVKESYPNHEIEIHEGNQPHYQFIIAIE